jgi:hypothetical protein
MQVLHAEVPMSSPCVGCGTSPDRTRTKVIDTLRNHVGHFEDTRVLICQDCVGACLRALLEDGE